MKRVIIPLLCATAIISSPVITFASGDDVNTEAGSEQQVEGTDSQSKIEEITLDDVITRGIENNKSLKIAQLNIEIMKNEVKMARKDKKKLTQKLEDGIDNLDVQVENLKQSLTSSYLNLLLLLEQIDNKKELVQSAVKEVNKNQFLYKLGRITRKNLESVELAAENEKRELAEMQKGYHEALTGLCLNIGVNCEQNLEIKPVIFDVKPIEKPIDIGPLIESSLEVKKASRNLKTVTSERYQVYRDDDSTKSEKENQDYYVQIAEENLALTKEEVLSKIEQVYREAENTYFAYEDMVSQLEKKKKELEELRVFYNLGRVSKYNFEQAQLGLQAAELDIVRAEFQYYEMKQSINTLQKRMVDMTEDNTID